MLAAAIVVSDSLGRGFDRGARAAGLPDVIVRFDPQATSNVAPRIRALLDLKTFSLRQGFTNVDIESGGHSSGRASIEVVGPGRRGYAIADGRDSARPPARSWSSALAAAWHVRLGGTLDIDGVGPHRAVGFSEGPDNVAFPLAVPRVYLSQAALERRFGGRLDPRVDYAELWLRDPRNLDEVLVQARATSYGVRGLRFITRSGVRVLIDQAAGIVIDLLVALSVIALATAGVMLAASARAEVQRRLTAIGVRRAVGASRGHLTLAQAFEALLITTPTAMIGALAGPKVRVPSDPARAEMDASEVIRQLRSSGSAPSPASATSDRLDYRVDVGPNVRLIVLDLARRDGGSGGLVTPGQPDWLGAELAAADDRFIIAVSHQPLISSEGGDALLALLDQHPRVIAAIAGHTHRNLIVPELHDHDRAAQPDVDPGDPHGPTSIPVMVVHGRTRRVDRSNAGRWRGGPSRAGRENARPGPRAGASSGASFRAAAGGSLPPRAAP